MRLPGRFLARVLLLRQGVRTLETIATQMRRQTALLETIAAHLLPATPSPTVARDLVDTGVSYHDPLEAALIEAYSEKVSREMGRAPSEEEILSYLADEKTLSLHARLKEREQLLRDQLGRSR